MGNKTKPTIEFVYDRGIYKGKEQFITWAEVLIEDRISVFHFEPHESNEWTYVHTIAAEDLDRVDPFLPDWGGRSLDRILTLFAIEEAKEAMKSFALNRTILKSTVCHVTGRDSGILFTRGYQVLIDLTDEERGPEVIAVYNALPEWRDSELRQWTPQLDRVPEVGDEATFEMLQWRA